MESYETAEAMRILAKVAEKLSENPNSGRVLFGDEICSDVHRFVNREVLYNFPSSMQEYENEVLKRMVVIWSDLAHILSQRVSHEIYNHPILPSDHMTRQMLPKLVFDMCMEIRNKFEREAHN